MIITGRSIGKRINDLVIDVNTNYPIDSRLEAETMLCDILGTRLFSDIEDSEDEGRRSSCLDIIFIAKNVDSHLMEAVVISRETEYSRAVDVAIICLKRLIEKCLDDRLWDELEEAEKYEVKKPGGDVFVSATGVVTHWVNRDMRQACTGNIPTGTNFKAHMDFVTCEGCKHAMKGEVSARAEVLRIAHLKQWVPKSLLSRRDQK